ncbi:MAG: enoyl-CoA hydratase/isomerase family protein [Planctomycetaceae bacterium]|nr:enoyl-CoA hydratase/isomerase family protein [Planctomycetales bacterium]MCB9923114.1 enoyl-CoA hydratase/isomerase family protein [Planctomycetaceae bacterium]
MTAETISLSMAEPDIAVLTFDTPKKGANVLSNSVLDELARHLDALEQRTDLSGLIFCSAKPGIFIAGADLREFVQSLGVAREQVIAMCRRGQVLFGRLAKMPFVTVAAINGICVGGGAELASWCDRRLFSNNRKAEFGFPEVKLGLFPGWGGTVRAPRIAGLGNAVEMVTGGESLSAETAYKMGWASDVVPDDQLLAAAIRLVRTEQTNQEYLNDRKRWTGPILITETELGFLGATASAVIRQQTKGQYPAPDAALETMLESSLLDADAACELEAARMAKLFGSPVNAALLNVFFLTDRNKKDTGIDGKQVEPRPINSVTVIGAGIMGSGIAAANVKRGIAVALTDASHESLVKGGRNVLEEASFDRETKGPNAQRMLELAPLLNLTTSEQEFAASDLVIEAVVENEKVKQSIYAQLESQLGPDTILASNTSTIPITKLAASLKRPDKFCGIHFFNPVRRMKLVEVIRGEKTSDETIATAVAYAKGVGKFPIVMNDGPGFLVNRLLFPYMHEAVELLCEGAEIKAIERASKSFGMPMGPIELYDLVGIDTAVYAGQTMFEAFPDRVISSALLPAMVQANRLGKKTGRGFYSYDNKKGRPEVDASLAEIIAPHIRKQRDFSLDELTMRLFLPMFLEATRVLEDEIVRDPRDIDLGLIFGLGFPPFKGGLMFWADTLGAATIVEMLKPFESLGDRMSPTKLLLEMAAGGEKFYK